MVLLLYRMGVLEKWDVYALRISRFLTVEPDYPGPLGGGSLTRPRLTSLHSYSMEKAHIECVCIEHGNAWNFLDVQ